MLIIETIMKIACDIFPIENYSVQNTSFSYCPKDLVTDKVNQPIQFSHSIVSLWDPMDCSMQGFPDHHQLPELAQTHSIVSDVIQPSHPLLFPSLSVRLSHGSLPLMSVLEKNLSLQWFRKYQMTKVLLTDFFVVNVFCTQTRRGKKSNILHS